MSAFTIKFMFADATTVSETFDAGTLVIDAKRKIIAAWPDGKDPINGPEHLKMIHGGKVLDNTKTFEDYKVPQRQQVIMHLQPTPPNVRKEASSAGENGSTPGERMPVRCCTVS